VSSSWRCARVSSAKNQDKSKWPLYRRRTRYRALRIPPTERVVHPKTVITIKVNDNEYTIRLISIAISTPTRRRASLPLNSPTRDQPPLIQSTNNNNNNTTIEKSEYGRLQTATRHQDRSQYFSYKRSSTRQYSQAYTGTTDV
jgi:hypothetical protein